jgi:hypothetical protein
MGIKEVSRKINLATSLMAGFFDEGDERNANPIVSG